MQEQTGHHVELGDSVSTSEEQHQLEAAPKKDLNLFGFVLLLLGPAAVLAVFVISIYVLFVLLFTGIGDNPAEELSLIASHTRTG